jgi:biopolymer transport protein ExbD
MGGAVVHSRGKRGGIVGINVTPMVDVVLVLLVIMMVSATYIVSQALKVELPKSASTDESVSMVASVTLTKDGKYYYDQKLVESDADLAARFDAAKAANADVNLVIVADAEALHGRVVHVIDIAKQHGVTKFAINVSKD